MSKGGSGSSMTQGGGQSSFGGQMPMQQQGYQSTFGNQNYRSQPSQPTFNNYSYQQPGQFGGQMMNQPMRSPGGKGGYSAPMAQQPMRSPGLKGGQPRSPVQIQPYPMPSPGGKGRSYQPPSTPYGYGQSTFNPGQFGGYGQPSNMFSFSSPHYQPYVPPVYEPPPPPPPPYRGDDPRDSGVTSSPPPPDYGFTPPTQPPAPINNQTLTPVMPKPTMPSREVPVFPSVGGIGGGQPSGIGSLMGLSGLPGRSESFTPPKHPLDTLLEERGFQVPERNQGAKTADMSMHGIDPVTGFMRFGSGSDRGYYRKLDEMYAQNPEALEIAKQYHADQLKKEIESARGGIFGPQKPMEQITYSPKQPVPLSPVAPPIQNETAAKNFWSQAQKAMDSGSLADADRFLRQYESITGTRNPMYGLSALDPSGYQSAIANR
jgi:hypothetical protein